MRPILVTGVAGFIGSHVARRLVAQGHEVVGVDDLSMGHRSNIPTEIDFVEGDLSKPATYDALPKPVDHVLHLAGQSSGEISFDDPVADLEKNTVSTLRLVDYAHRSQASKIVYASSMSVYGDVPDAPIAEGHLARPLSCYGVGKLAAENYLKVFAKRTPSLSFRMFNVYGPGQDMTNLRQGMISIYVAQALANNHIVVKGSFDRFRDFVYIDDVVDAWELASRQTITGAHVVNLGTGVRTTVRDVLDMIVAAIPGVTIEQSDPTPGDQTGIYCDNSRLASVLGKRDFVTLGDGLQRFVASLR